MYKIRNYIFRTNKYLLVACRAASASSSKYGLTSSIFNFITFSGNCFNVLFLNESSCFYQFINYVFLFYHIARNDRWFAHLHIQNGGSKIIWILTYSWTGNFLLAWAGQFAGIKNQTMHRFEHYLKILQLYHENSRFPPSFKFWSVSAIQKHWEEVKKCILHGFQDLKVLFLQSPF